MKSIGMLSVFCAICVTVASAGVISAPEREADENLRKLALANNELAFNLHRRLAFGTSKNVFFSPLSISTAFGMLFYGARGETAEELREALGYKKAGLPDHLVHETFNRFLREVLKSEDSSTGYVLNAANAVLADRGLELLEDYRNDVQELYRATVRDVDFSRESPRIVDEIKDWVREKTNGKFTNLLDELNPSAISVLLNAVYFKGTWKFEFDRKKTKYTYFYNSGLPDKKIVPLMRMIEKLPYARFDNFQALELPYKGENVSMLILLPKEINGLRSLEQSLTPERLAEIYRQLHITTVDVKLPKFKVEYEKEIKSEMINLGADEIFRSGSADFFGMTHRRDVSVSQILHKAVFEVDEEGSEADAATGIISFRRGLIQDQSHFEPNQSHSEPNQSHSLTWGEFWAKHPFLFAIVERGVSSNMILFLGRVSNL